eukprot:4060927-Heterocapsa_arctica.AAC.1
MSSCCRLLGESLGPIEPCCRLPGECPGPIEPGSANAPPFKRMPPMPRRMLANAAGAFPRMLANAPANAPARLGR